MRKRLQLILGGLFFAFLIVYSGELFVQTVVELSKDSDPGWTPYTIGSQVRVLQFGSAEPAGLLKFSDEVIALNGQPVTSESQVSMLFRDIPPGSPYRITVRRNGQVLDFALQS